MQHILLMITFLVQVFTGFPLSFPETWWAKGLVSLMGGWEMRTHIHHISGVIMVIVGVYHVLYVLHRKISKGHKLKMMPDPGDIKEFFQYLKHLFRLGPEPKADRYNWKEKFEYWGVVWGTIVMGATGLILMYPFIALSIIPLGWIYIASLLHFYEALLATLVVIVWHFYNVHFHPHWPLQKTWITGKVSKKHMEEHHPLELEEILKSEAET